MTFTVEFKVKAGKKKSPSFFFPVLHILNILIRVMRKREPMPVDFGCEAG